MGTVTWAGVTQGVGQSGSQAGRGVCVTIISHLRVSHSKYFPSFIQLLNLTESEWTLIALTDESRRNQFQSFHWKCSAISFLMNFLLCVVLLEVEEERLCHLQSPRRFLSTDHLKK